MFEYSMSLETLCKIGKKDPVGSSKILDYSCRIPTIGAEHALLINQSINQSVNQSIK